MTFEIVKAEEKDYELFASIIQEVYEAMEEKEWFAADNAEYTYEMLKYSNGVGYKAIHQLGRGGWNFTYDISWGFRGKSGARYWPFGIGAFAGGSYGFRGNSSGVPWCRPPEKADAARGAGTGRTGIPLFYVHGAPGKPVQQAEYHQTGL